MDAILFGVKRAHMALEHRLAAKILAPYGLTPARFDALYVIDNVWGKSQASVRRALGIAGTTLGRMLKSLEALAFVVREPLSRGRRRYVRLTARGLRVLRRAKRRTQKDARRRIDSTFAQSPATSFEDRENVEWWCRTIRTRLGDGAYIYYPWHPDD